MDPISLTLAITAIVISSVTAFFKRLKHCKASRCCEIDMRSDHGQDNSHEDDILDRISNLIVTEESEISTPKPSPKLLRHRSISEPIPLTTAV